MIHKAPDDCDKFVINERQLRQSDVSLKQSEVILDDLKRPETMSHRIKGAKHTL